VTFQVVIPENFRRVMKRKDPRLRMAIRECIERLTEDPRHPGLQTHKMRGAAGVWECYVDKGNRVTFAWVGNTIVLRNNCNHDMLARNP
jgi:hypothetical protein